VGDNREVTDDHGRRLLDTGFSGDTGAPDPALADALASYAAEPGLRVADVLEALAGVGGATGGGASSGARLLVPVVAVLGEVEVDGAGLAHDKSSDMAAVLLTGADGRLALLAFTSTDAMRRWNPEARPVPVAAALAAQAAVQEGAAALVVDVAGPVTFVVEAEDLQGLAAGWAPARVGDRAAWIRPAPE
jgi:hypothetical protein